MSGQPTSRYLFGFLPWYSTLIVLGMALAVLLASGEEKRRGLPEDTMIDLALRLIPAGIIGARLYYVLFSLPAYLAQPLHILYVWEGGLAIYGGLIGGGLAALVFARRRKLSLLALLDALIPGVALAQSIGRWGNYFNMEAYGAPVEQPFFRFFPAAVLIGSGDGAVWHYATFFYESVWDLLVFICLWRMRKKPMKNGDMFAMYLLLYGAGRFVIEGLRSDSLYVPGTAIRISQLLSAVLCILCLALFIRRAFGLRAACLLTAFCLAASILLIAGKNTLLQLIFAMLLLLAAAVCRRILRRKEFPCRQAD